MLKIRVDAGVSGQTGEWYVFPPCAFFFFSLTGWTFGLLTPGQHGGRGCSAAMTTGLPSVPIEYAELCREREAGAEVQLLSFKKIRVFAKSSWPLGCTRGPYRGIGAANGSAFRF